MFSISIGGPCSGAGKTELLCAILKSFPDRFTAVKWSAVICPQGHCRSEKNRCECGRLEGDSPGYVIEERNSELAAAGKDTGRYLTSGARRVFWVVSRRAKAPLALTALLTGAPGFNDPATKNILQAARARRDEQLKVISKESAAETERQSVWLTTRIKQAAAQALAVK